MKSFSNYETADAYTLITTFPEVHKIAVCSGGEVELRKIIIFASDLTNPPMNIDLEKVNYTELRDRLFEDYI